MSPHYYGWKLAFLVLSPLFVTTTLLAEEPPAKPTPLVQSEMDKLTAHSWDLVGTVFDSKIPLGDQVYFFEADGDLIDLSFHAERHQFTIDPTTDPKQLTVRYTDRSERTYDWPWIYKWDGDNLIISRAASQEDDDGNITFRGPPKNFEYAEGFAAKLAPGPKPRLPEYAILRGLPGELGALAFTPDGKQAAPCRQPAPKTLPMILPILGQGCLKEVSLPSPTAIKSSSYPAIRLPKR